MAMRVTNWWLSEEATQLKDDRELLARLHDSVLHQVRCTPQTVEPIELLAGVFRNDRVAAPFRLWLVLLIAEIGTVGRRLAAQDADRRSALELGVILSAHELAVERAVEAIARVLLRRWPDECEAVRCGLAFLSAAFPDSAYEVGIIESIGEFAATCEPHRAAMLTLVYALASAEESALPYSYKAAITITPIELSDIPSPLAPAVFAGLDVLHRMLQLESGLVFAATFG
ncbi:hypothetical protein [Nocardia jejuensis]|uniref:hypothetical protein n=1 Tax=Nocardia jejuensis TaxID=328049 RepID=UPI00082A20C3|nr:hypothetical protein [Nocardia jejuensis]